jgi:hypothetical protein
VRPYGLTATAVSCSAFSAVAAFSADALHRLVLPHFYEQEVHPGMSIPGSGVPC